MMRNKPYAGNVGGRSGSQSQLQNVGMVWTVWRLKLAHGHVILLYGVQQCGVGDKFEAETY